MLTPVEFLAEPGYEYCVIQCPNEIEDRWRCELQVAGNMYSGYAENGHAALIAAIRRYRDTDPDMPGSQTMTINADRGHHRRD